MAHPRMYEDSDPLIAKLREVCLKMPEVFEKEAWGECTFRVAGGSMFAMTDNNHHGSGHLAVWVKAPEMVQEILVNSDPKRFFVPPYMGKKGWVGMRIDGKIKWEQAAAILKDGYLLSMPAKSKTATKRASAPAGDRTIKPRATRARRRK